MTQVLPDGSVTDGGEPSGCSAKRHDLLPLSKHKIITKVRVLYGGRCLTDSELIFTNSTLVLVLEQLINGARL